jgi:circadian clock protein KaiC
MAKKRRARREMPALEKCPTGIRGLDEITEGGLPRGRPTLVCGPAGCGKTLLGMEFIVRGITEYNEPGVFMAFEENADELAANVASLGMNVQELIRRKKMAIDYVHIERSEIEDTGEYDLEGLFVRLGSMIDAIGAKRVVLDTIEALFAGLPNEAILRAELRRLFRWLKAKKVTAIITGERGDNQLTRHGLEEYVSDCVIALDHRVINQIATRRLRIIKYRGSKHGTNEYPTMIDESGLSVLPISSLGLNYPVTTARISSGIPRLDTMLGGKGYYRGTTVLVSGTAGSGKTSMAAAFADSICRRGEKCLYMSFEESPSQIIRNMQSIGFDLDSWIQKGLLRFNSIRPTLYGLETHLVSIHKIVEEFEPTAVVMDPITNLTSVSDLSEIKSMLMRMIDYLKNRKITAFFTSLTSAGGEIEQTEAGISSLIDTWLTLRNVESDGERNRLLYILKSRGMAHSNQVREFILSDNGITLREVYVGPGAVLTGSARLVQEAKDRSQETLDKQTLDRRQRELRQQQMAIEAQIAALKAQGEGLDKEMKQSVVNDRHRDHLLREQRRELTRIRKADSIGKGKNAKHPE